MYLYLFTTTRQTLFLTNSRRFSVSLLSYGDEPSQREIKEYTEVVKDEIMKIHKDYSASLPSPDQYSQTELDERVARGVASVRRTYVGLPREQDEQRAKETDELLQRIQARNSVRFRDDLAERHRRVAQKSDLHKQLQKEPEKPERTYEIVER